MKKKIQIIILIFILTGIIHSQSQLHELISRKEWGKISLLFSDSSHKILPRYFKLSTQIRFVTYNISQLTYKAKFRQYAEIGTITYETKNGKYFNLKIKNQISPLFFIENLHKYPVKDKLITLGDARIYFKEGHFFHSQPFGQVLFFHGLWDISIYPSDDEEKLTLKYLFKNETFSKSNKWGIFKLKNKDFLKSLTLIETVKNDNPVVLPYIKIYNDYFGVKIKQFNESWFLPFKEEDNLIIFEKNKNTFYLYDFNKTVIPDTQLRTSNQNEITLSYNSVKTSKIRIKRSDKIERINLSLFYNPENGFLSGTAILVFNNSSSFRVLNLAKNLKIKASLNLDVKGLSVIRKGNVYYFLGPPTNTLSFFYSGHINPVTEYTDIFKKQTYEIETLETEKLYFLSRTQNYYPNNRIDFSKSNLSISLPKNYYCLASGQLIHSSHSTRNLFKYNARGTKGISLACGSFVSVKKIKSKIPINLFTTPTGVKSKEFRVDSYAEPFRKNVSGYHFISKYFSFDKIKKSFNFFIKKFGGLDISEINLLLRKDLQERGASNRGFIFFNYNPDLTLSQRITRKSPIILSQDPTNHLIHELAHQWWGGIISWDTYKDIWITEGFAQFSLLYFLEKHLSEKKFNRILKRMKKSIYKNNDSGPVSYGKRIISINNDYEAYQSIVYNKAAFVLFMLKEMIGEKDFLKRIKNILKYFKYRSITTSDFVNQFAKKNTNILNFFAQWINKRKIPTIKYHVKIKNRQAQLSVTQMDSEYIFPLFISIKTSAGMKKQTLLVSEKIQQFNIFQDAKIDSIRINTSRSLVRVK